MSYSMKSRTIMATLQFQLTVHVRDERSLLSSTWTIENVFVSFYFSSEIVKSPYWFVILFNQTLRKSLGGTKILSFNEVFNSLPLCFVYLVLFYKPFQTFIFFLLVQYRYTVTIQHPVRLIVDWFFRRCIYIGVKPLIHQSELRTYTKIVPFHFGIL